MQPRGTREKIKVDQDDLVMDVYSFYKSPDFDPTVPVFVLLKGQPAIDSGGVLRQVFSDVFYAMANNEGIKNVFNEDKNSKVPAFSNGLFEVLGKMIAHSLIQSGPVSHTCLLPFTGIWQLVIYRLPSRRPHAQMWMTLNLPSTSRG